MSGREVVSWKQNNKSHFWNVHFPQTLFIYSSRFHSLWFGLDHVRRVCSRRISLPVFLFHSTRFWIDWITIVINVFSFQITHKFGKHPKCSWNYKNVYFHKRSFSFLSIRKSKLLWVKNPLATHHHLPRPIQIQGMPVECYAVKKKHKMLERQYIEISTGQSASPSLERLPSSSPTTQPSQWWGTSMKYLQLDWVTTTLCLHRVIISY